MAALKQSSCTAPPSLRTSFFTLLYDSIDNVYTFSAKKKLYISHPPIPRKCKSSTAALPDCKNRWNFSVSDRRWGAGMHRIKEIGECILHVGIQGKEEAFSVFVRFRESCWWFVFCEDLDTFLFKKQGSLVLLFCLFDFSTAVCRCKGCIVQPSRPSQNVFCVCVCVRVRVCVRVCVRACSLWYVTTASMCVSWVWLAFDESLLFQLSLTSLFSPTLRVLTVRSLSSRRLLSSIHLSPPTHCSISPLWIIQACRASVFLVVVTSAVTQTKPILASTHAHTHSHMQPCQHVRPHTGLHKRDCNKQYETRHRDVLTTKDYPYRDFTPSLSSTLSLLC